MLLYVHAWVCVRGCVWVGVCGWVCERVRIRARLHCIALGCQKTSVAWLAFLRVTQLNLQLQHLLFWDALDASLPAVHAKIL